MERDEVRQLPFFVCAMSSDNDDDAVKGPAKPQPFSVTATAILNSGLTADRSTLHGQ